jgi:hypothetical protein
MKEIGTSMKKTVLSESVHYYEGVIEDFEKVIKTIEELREIGNLTDSQLWDTWTASDDKTFIYGESQVFDLDQINNMRQPYRDKMEFVYIAIMKAFYNVSKDYARAVGDLDDPRLFPVFNIKKYDTGMGMGAHYDQLDGDKTLRYSLVMYLNDDYEGGEISFKLSKYEDNNQVGPIDLDYLVATANNQIDFGVKPSAGSIIIFPSSAPHYHIAHTVKSGEKYMIPSHWIHNDMDMKRNSCGGPISN